MLSGGNVDVSLLSEAIRLGETAAGRRMVLSTVVPDRPGALAGLLRAGNAGSNTTADHIAVLGQALDSLPPHYRPGPDNPHAPPILIRSDSAGATYGFAAACRHARVGFSLGCAIDAAIRDAVDTLNTADAWYPAMQSDGAIREVRAPRVAVLGTDCALGKRTTARLLVEACRRAGLRAEMIFTGQTGWMQGGRYGFILDSTPNDFVAGEVEHAIVTCDREARPDVIVIEGQSAFRNPSGPCGAELVVSGQARATRIHTCALQGSQRRTPARWSVWRPRHKIALFSRTEALGGETA